jgi:hypothetical protein
MRSFYLGVLAAFTMFACAALAAAEPGAAAPFTGGMIDRDPSVTEPAGPAAALVAPIAPHSRVEVPGTTPGGGWKVEGPFMHTLRATTGPDGQVSTDCVPSRSGE